MIAIRSKHAMQLIALCLFLASGSALLWAYTTPVAVTEPSAPQSPRAGEPLRKRDAQREVPGLTTLWNRLFARRFQRALYDPPPKRPPPVKKKKIPPPPVEVIATMPEPAGGSAMIKDDKGNVSVVRIGSTITAGGSKATLLNVYDDRVELQHDGTVITVKLKTD